MTTEPRLTLDIQGELTAETNGVTTTVIGSGSLVNWDLVNSARVAQSGSLPGRADIRRLARKFARHGVTVTISEGDRPLLELGSVRSSLGAIVFGATSVRPRSLWRLARLAWKART